MKFFILVATLVFPFLAHASGKLVESKAIQSTVVETSAFLKQEFSRELKQSVGLDEFILKVELKIDEKKLQSTLGVNEEDWNKLQGLSLPGLFVEGKEGYAISSLRQAKKEDILMSLSGIKIDLIYHQTNYSVEFLNTALKKVVAFNIPLLKEGQIEIASKMESAPYRISSPRPEEALAKAFSKPFDVNVTQNEFQNFWNQYYKVILLGAAGFLLAIGLIFSFAVKGSLGSLSDVIKSKTFSMPSARDNTPMSPEAHHPHAKQDNLGDTFESYMQANEYLTVMINKEPKVFNEVIILKLMAEDFISLTILLDVLSKEKRETFLANIDHDKKDRFKQFIVGQGTAVLKDEALLKEEAVKMIKLVKVASLSPGELYQIVITDLVSSLTYQDLSALLKNTNPAEMTFICDLLEANQLALLVQNDIISAADLEQEISLLSKAEMVDLLIKASSIRGFKKTKVKKEKLESVYAQVETDKAEVLADAMGLEPELRFEYLFTTFHEPALNYIEAMDFERLSLLYPLFTEGMKQDVLKQLPELLAERLRFAKKKVNSESLKLKGDFYFYLRSLSDAEEGPADHIKLVA